MASLRHSSMEWISFVGNVPVEETEEEEEEEIVAGMWSRNEQPICSGEERG